MKWIIGIRNTVYKSLILSVLLNGSIFTLISIFINVFDLKEKLNFPFSILDGIIVGSLLGLIKFEIFRIKNKKVKPSRPTIT